MHQRHTVGGLDRDGMAGERLRILNLHLPNTVAAGISSFPSKSQERFFGPQERGNNSLRPFQNAYMGCVYS